MNLNFCLVWCVQYLCDGLEDDIWGRQRDMGQAAGSELEQMIAASGKMVLLHKLLPKLRSEGRKVMPHFHAAASSPAFASQDLSFRCS